MKLLFRSIFNEKTYKIALPYILILLGGGCFTYSIFGTFYDAKLKEFFNGIGMSILAGGIFALLLKTIQFMGVFKEELTKVIFEPKYLTNRNDLPSYWDKVSVELFKNKFPGISQKLLKDVKEIYFPTKHPVYYEDVEHFVEVLSIDEKGNALIKKTTTLTLICNDKSIQCEYEFGNKMPFKENENEVKFISDVIKVNSAVVNELIKDRKILDNIIHNTFKVKLKGKEKYVIERIEEKKYNILFDNVVFYKTNKILNKLRVEFHHPENLEIILKKCGTLDEFHMERESKTFRRYFCKGIIYPEQGYSIIYKLKN